MVLHLLERERGLPGAVDSVADHGLLDAGHTKAGLVELFLQNNALALALVLRATEPGQRLAQLGNVVGEEARPGIPNDRRNQLRLPRDLSLLAERLELAPDLTGQVRKPGQVGLHRIELAKSLLLAAAMLQDAGRLLDEPAPLIGAGVQDGVELALANNDVHLAAEP